MKQKGPLWRLKEGKKQPGQESGQLQKCFLTGGLGNLFQIHLNDTPTQPAGNWILGHEGSQLEKLNFFSLFTVQE